MSLRTITVLGSLMYKPPKALFRTHSPVFRIMKAGLPFDQAYTRFHQDFAFFQLPALVTSILVFEAFNVTGKMRRIIGYLYFVGSFVTFIFSYTYAMITLDFLSLTLAAFGGVLMGLGVLLGAEQLRKTGKWTTT